MNTQLAAMLIMPVGSLLVGLFVAVVAMRTAKRDLPEDPTEPVPPR